MLSNSPKVPVLLAKRAKELRNQMTAEERHIWYDCLKKFKDTFMITFNRQYVITPYIVDFYCADAGLIIEIDGFQHYDEAGRLYDQKRTAYLESFHLKVVRFTNRQVHENFKEICFYLENLLNERLVERGQLGLYERR